jgi:hypothetical protein
VSVEAVATPERDAPASEETVALTVQGRFPGRIVLAEPDGTLHLGRNYEIHRSEDAGRSWQRVTAMPLDPLRRLANPSRLLCRLLRQEVRALARSDTGGYVASNRQGVFVAKPGEARMRPSAIEAGGDLPIMPPMRIAKGPAGEIIWGEYGSPKERRPMRLFVSRDAGESFQLVRVLEGILHVHNVVWDPRERHYWVLTGDFDPEPGIGRLSADLERFEWFVHGEQRYRAVEIFDLGDRLVYATDTQLEPNALISLDKSTGQAERLREFDGSCIYACCFGGIYALTTSVEPSPVNRGQHSELWLSRDAEHWRCAWRGRKDRWSANYLQFGSVVLPSGRTDRELLVFSGQAIVGLDGHTTVARLGPGVEI